VGKAITEQYFLKIINSININLVIAYFTLLVDSFGGAHNFYTCVHSCWPVFFVRVRLLNVQLQDAAVRRH